MKEPKVYTFDSVQEGSHNPWKLGNVYRALRNAVLTDEPTQQRIKQLAIVEKDRPLSPYGWELYTLGQGPVAILEYVLEGFGDQIIFSPPPRDWFLRSIKLTIHNSTPDLEETIEDIIARFPREKSEEITNPAQK